MEHYWQATYLVPLTAIGERSMEAITGAPARSSKEDETELQGYAVVTSEAA